MLVVVAVVLGVLVVTVNVVDVVFVGHGLVTALRPMLVLGGCVLCVDFVFSHGGPFKTVGSNYLLRLPNHIYKRIAMYLSN